MGNLYSGVADESKKLKDDTHNEGSTVEAKTPSPFSGDGNQVKNRKLLGLIPDPRSPTQGVSRTPLEVEERNRRIEKSRIMNQLNKENNLSQCEVDGDESVTTPTGPPNKDLLSAFDPRSPNPEINRTPIALANPPTARKVFQNCD